MKKLNLIISIFALTMLFSAFSLTANAIGASPLRIELNAEPGETVEGHVKAQNSKDEAQVIVLKKGDFLVDENEDLQFVDYDENNKYSLQNWIDLSENNVPVEANGNVKIKYQVNVPQDAASQSYYGIIYISSQNPTIVEGPGGVGIQTNVAQLVLLEVGDELKSDVELNDFTLTKLDANVRFDTALFNNGNTHDSLSGTIIITDSKLKTLEELTFNREKHNAMPEAPKTYKEQFKSFAEYEDDVYFAYLNAVDENNNLLAAELKFRINKGEVEMLNLELGKSYTQALKEYGQVPWVPIIIIGLALLIALISGRLCCKKSKRKTKK